MLGSRQRRVVNQNGNTRIRTFRTGENSINRNLKQDGYLYDVHSRSWKRAIKEGWNAVLTSDESEFTLKQIENYSKVEEHIRNGVFKSIDRVNRHLSDVLPVAYDEKNDLWVVNDYTSKRSGHNLPIEIKMRFNSDAGTYEMLSYQFRGEEDQVVADELEQELNSRPTSPFHRGLPLKEKGELKKIAGEDFDFASERGRVNIKKLNEIAKREAKILRLKRPNVKVVNSRNAPKHLGQNAVAGISRYNNLYINVDNLVNAVFVERKTVSKVVEGAIRHELLHKYVQKNRIRAKSDLLELKKLGYSQQEIDEESTVRKLTEESD